MSNIFQDLKPHSKNARNVFDLSHSSTYSSKNALNTPVFIQHTIPDADYQIKVSSIIRTAPMQTANFTAIKSNFEFFFVPYSQLWKNFNRMYYGRGENTRNQANIYNNTISDIVPNFSLRGVTNELFRYGFYQMYFDFHLTPLINRITQQAQFTGIDNLNLQLLLQRLESFRNYMFGSVTGWVMSSPGQYNFRSVHGEVCVLDMIRNLDMLGYGNILPILKTLYSYFYSDERLELDLTAVRGEDLSQLGFTMVYDLNSANYADASNQLSKAFGDVYNYFNVNNLIQQVYPSALSLMAFMKINADYYRSSQYDTTDYAFFYNNDWAQDDQDNSLPVYRVLQMLKPFYHLYKRDILTGSFSDTQFGDVAVAGVPSYSLENTDLFSWKTPSGEIVSSDLFKSVNENGDSLITDASSAPVDSYLVTVPNTLPLSVLAMRQALALQHWKEAILRAGTRENDLQKAIFGVSSKYIQDEYVDFLDGCAGDINVNPIASTSATEQADLGELGAFAVGTVKSDTIHFHSKDFGIIIGVEYVLPEVKYNAYGIDPMNRKLYSTDFYNPKLQNLGLAPVFSLDLNAFQAPVVYGYLSRYYEYKTKVSVVHGEFFNSNPVELLSLDGYNGSIDAGSYNNHAVSALLANLTGSKSFWVSPRSVTDLRTLSLNTLYANPHDLDNLFYASSDASQMSDQFDFETYFEVKAILPMSVTGLPNLI